MVCNPLVVGGLNSLACLTPFKVLTTHMAENVQNYEEGKEPAAKRWKPGETRSLNGDERISFTVFSLYLFIFCACTYLFWPSLPMEVLGGTAAVLGFMLFTTALFNPGKADRKHSPYTRKWYLVAFMGALVVLVGLRSVVRHVDNHVTAIAVIYGSLTALFIVFRKAIMQILMALAAVVFLLVTAFNWSAAVQGQLGFMDVLGKCGQAIFKVQEIEEVANTIIAGNYLGYLNKVDYRDEQLNLLAIRTVADTGDDELAKAKALLDFVSNEIHYVSDPNDGVEFVRDPVTTIISGGGDCEDQTVVLCSMLESVGVKTYMAFTPDHVFALVSFSKTYPELAHLPYIDIEGKKAYILDAADPGAEIGYGAAAPVNIERVFDVQRKALVHHSVPGNR